MSLFVPVYGCLILCANGDAGRLVLQSPLAFVQSLKLISRQLLTPDYTAQPAHELERLFAVTFLLLESTCRRQSTHGKAVHMCCCWDLNHQ